MPEGLHPIAHIKSPSKGTLACGQAQLLISAELVVFSLVIMRSNISVSAGISGNASIICAKNCSALGLSLSGNSNNLPSCKASKSVSIANYLHI